MCRKGNKNVRRKGLETTKDVESKDWTDTFKHVVDQYNDKEHTTTGVTPYYASTAKYQDVVRTYRKESNTQ